MLAASGVELPLVSYPYSGGQYLLGGLFMVAGNTTITT